MQYLNLHRLLLQGGGLAVALTRRVYQLGGPVLLGLVLATAAVTAGCGPSQAETGNPENEPPVDDVATAARELEAAMAADPRGEAGGRAALELGYLLLRQRRRAAALAPLRRAAHVESFSPYARLLLVRAVVEGELEAAYDEAAGVAAALSRGDTTAPAAPALAREEAAFLGLRLDLLRGRWQQAAAAGRDFLGRFTSSRRRDEARWLMAEARRQAGEATAAHSAYETIWFDTPASPWASEARARLDHLESDAGLKPRRLAAAAHYEFIKALRAAGHHRPAVVEVAAFLERNPRHPKTDSALFLQAMSQHALRRNDDCVATVERLWRDHPRSRWLPAAGIHAIKVHRRSNNTVEIRRWAQRILDRYPRHDKALATLFELGGHLGNVVDKDEGIRVLERLVDEGGRHDTVDDALWKIIWYERQLGRTEKAKAALERLLREHPRSSYRVSALYWLASFLADTDRDRAIGLYRSCLAEFPHEYYGHRSREHLRRLGAGPRTVPSPGPFPATDRLVDPGRRSEPAYRLAVGLKTLGLYEFAATELEAVTARTRDRGLRLALAELYSLAGRTADADAIVSRYFGSFIASGSRDPSQVPEQLWRVVYPFGYRFEIETALEEFDRGRSAGAQAAGTQAPDPFLVAALIRRESRFQPNAVSPVGAIGLMQLMPATAEQVAHRLALAPPKRSDLFDPRLNVRLGTAYLAQMIAQFGGETVPAICSYNADVAVVRRWWRTRPPDQPIDEFIETIPYAETRLYVKKVLGSLESYRWIYGDEPSTPG